LHLDSIATSGNPLSFHLTSGFCHCKIDTVIAVKKADDFYGI
jgi:hypothetical protein